MKKEIDLEAEYQFSHEEGTESERAKAQRPVQREAKEVVAELVEKLRGKLEQKSTSTSPADAGPGGELSSIRTG